METKKLSFVIPCYGSENTIEFVINEINEMMAQKPGYAYEIICVNDASPDNVLSVLEGIAKNDKRVTVADLARNFGKHCAVMAGFSKVTGDYIVSLDDDGQCPMNRLWELMEPLFKDEADYTMADYTVKSQSDFKNFGSSVNSLMSRIMLGKPKELHFSNFCAMKRYVMDEIVRYENPYPYLEGLILRTTTKIVTIPMEERDRVAGKGNFTLFKSLSLWMNGFTAFSVKPLRIATIIGTICALLGFLFGLYVIIRKIIHPAVAMGYSSTMAVLLFIGGIIMLMLGLIGEYIGRVYISLNNSPQFVIREIINEDEE